jgi:hypothetical protein
MVGAGKYTDMLEEFADKIRDKFYEAGIETTTDRQLFVDTIKAKAKEKLRKVGSTRDEGPVSANPRRDQKEDIVLAALEEIKAYYESLVGPERSKFARREGMATFIGFKEELDLLAKEALAKADQLLRTGKRGSIPADLKRYISHVIARAKEEIKKLPASSSALPSLQREGDVRISWMKWGIVEEAMGFIEDALGKAIRDAYKVMRTVIPSKAEVDRMIRLVDARSRIKAEVEDLARELPPRRKPTKKEFGQIMRGSGMKGGAVYDRSYGHLPEYFFEY